MFYPFFIAMSNHQRAPVNLQPIPLVPLVQATASPSWQPCTGGTRMRRGGLWTNDHWGRARVFHRTCAIYNRWHGSCSSRVTQENDFSLGREERATLLKDHWLAPLLAKLRFDLLRHSVHLRCAIFQTISMDTPIELAAKEGRTRPAWLGNTITHFSLHSSFTYYNNNSRHYVVYVSWPVFCLITVLYTSIAHVCDVGKKYLCGNESRYQGKCQTKHYSSGWCISRVYNI